MDRWTQRRAAAPRGEPPPHSSSYSAAGCPPARTRPPAMSTISDDDDVARGPAARCEGHCLSTVLHCLPPRRQYLTLCGPIERAHHGAHCPFDRASTLLSYKCLSSPRVGQQLAEMIGPGGSAGLSWPQQQGHAPLPRRAHVRVLAGWPRRRPASGHGHHIPTRSELTENDRILKVMVYSWNPHG